jgi:hypothetical protein
MEIIYFQITGDLEEVSEDEAFGIEEGEAAEAERLLEEETSGEPINDGEITVYLPSLETPKKTYQFSDLDYQVRVETIEEMQSRQV